MSGRIEKSRAKKTRERSILFDSISLLGVSADMPCTHCFKNKKACRMVERSSRCQECVRRGRQCDGVLVASSLERLLSQQRKLEAEEDEANDNLGTLYEKMTELQSQLSSAMGRLSRIRKIRSQVKNKMMTEVQRGVIELDEEDGILPALESHEQFVVGDLQSLGVSNEMDWSTLGLGDEFAELGSLVPSGDANIPQESSR